MTKRKINIKSTVATDDSNFMPGYIKTSIDALLTLSHNIQETKSAVFDMDNTILFGDMGDAALANLIENEVPIGMTWSDYLNMISDGEIVQAYKMASKVFSGMEVSCVRKLANIILDDTNSDINLYEDDEPYKVQLPKINPIMHSVISYLLKLNFNIYIISASNQYLVEEVAARFDIPASNCFGIKNKIQIADGVDILDSKILNPVPVAEGKAKLFTKIFKKDKPIIAGGDSLISDCHFLNLVNTPGIIFWLGKEDMNNVVLQSLAQGRYIIDMKKFQIGS